MLGKSPSSPHPWGCFYLAMDCLPDEEVFPTPVGVFPVSSRRTPMTGSLPHTRGGVSKKGPRSAKVRGSSPHPWGCFSNLQAVFVEIEVFPTPVGVFPVFHRQAGRYGSLPHTRGGVSRQRALIIGAELSSPHPWGCFSARAQRAPGRYVFPTPVGVFPFPICFFLRSASLPHTRGGVSSSKIRSQRYHRSSPHPWGCFLAARARAFRLGVFPTPVGVFPIPTCPAPSRPRLPHTRGGVSITTVAISILLPSSPHPWGCFPRPRLRWRFCRVFPTPVGVFLHRTELMLVFHCLPHTRGGVSLVMRAIAHATLSSPHPWGCFHTCLSLCSHLYVFPTPVGVFPPFVLEEAGVRSLPHTRGGVSPLSYSAGRHTVVFPTPVGVFHNERYCYV